MNNYKLGSLFDGSGGFPLSGALCGIEPVWAAEVEPYPIAVTRSRFPNMKHLGDISKVNGAEIEPVDIITFGSPCQDLSVAGKRAGLKHEANGDEETTRSGLFMEAVRIIKEMRKATNGKYPTFAIWENVPGAFSSNNGEDFRIVCEELIKVVEPSASMPGVPKNGWNYADSYVGDGWSLAYRVFDAQYWGVPQRRRRIYLVTDFRGERAREVLFEREGLRGYFTQGGTPWQTTPDYAQGSTGADDREGAGLDTDGGAGRGRGLDDVGVINAIGGNAENYSETQTLPTLTCSSAPGFGNAVAVPYTLKIRSGVAVDSNGKGAGKGALIQKDKSATLGCSNDQYLFQPVEPTFIIDNVGGQAEYAKASQVNGTLRAGAQGLVAYAPTNPVYCLQGNGIDRADTAGCNGKGVKEDVSYTLNTIDRPAVAYAVDQGGGKSGANVHEDVSPTLTCTHGGAPAVSYGLDRASFNQGQNAKFDFTVSEEQQPTLTARGPGAVCTIGLSGGQVSPTLISRMSSAVGTTQDNLIVTQKRDATLGSGKDVAGCLMASGYDKLGAQEMFSGDYTVIEEHPAFCCTTGSFTQATEEVSPTLMARDWKDPTVVLTNYIVRRLTPTECARLQGFADWWGVVEQKKELTEEEYHFWKEVRNTHARINGKKEQDYTEKQMLTWYNKLWTDSAEYKMWGNGIALPTALYCIQGMAEALAKVETHTEEDLDDWMN